MTNYEYLISTNSLNDFIINMHEKDWDDIHSLYNIPNNMCISSWLQEEHNAYCYIIQCAFVDDNIDDVNGTEAYKIRKIYKSKKAEYLAWRTYDTLKEARLALAEHIRKRDSNE